MQNDIEYKQITYIMYYYDYKNFSTRYPRYTIYEQHKSKSLYECRDTNTISFGRNNWW